jgi:hypothetical protein
MNCPYCNKEINGLTGLQELQKFQKHLRTCKKKDKPVIAPNGSLVDACESTDMLSALNIRANSGQ